MYPIGSGMLAPSTCKGGGLTKNGFVIPRCRSSQAYVLVTVALGLSGFWVSVGSPEGPLTTNPSRLLLPLATLPAVCPARLPKIEAGLIQCSFQLIKLLFHCPGGQYRTSICGPVEYRSRGNPFSVPMISPHWST